MRLKEKCYDAMLYKMFYRSFITDFSRVYNLEQSVDLKTCDVTRACFVSYDEQAYFNKEAEPVDMDMWLHRENSQQLWDQLRKQKDEVPFKCESKDVKVKDPDVEMMLEIKQRLNGTSSRIKEKKEIYVPQILDDISDDLKCYIESLGLIVNDITNINYGKKFAVALGKKRSEVNLFYGKKGFSVVATTKSGTDRELAELVTEVISTFLDMYI